MNKVALCVFLLAMMAWPASAQTLLEPTGIVTTPDGDPIVGVLVIASGAGFGGWTETKAYGSFTLPAAREFMSFRHPRYAPQLVRLSNSGDALRIQLKPGDVRTLERCTAMPNGGKEWVGRGLRVKPSIKPRGPVYGEHNSHWSVRKGKDTLHIVSGIYWHAGLPLDKTLDDSRATTVRGWTFGEIAVLDISGRTSAGGYWRWVGAPLEDSIEYKTNERSTAEYFDKIIDTLCWGN